MFALRLADGNILGVRLSWYTSCAHHSGVLQLCTVVVVDHLW